MNEASAQAVTAGLVFLGGAILYLGWEANKLRKSYENTAGGFLAGLSSGFRPTT